jgi:hypothetical protein
MKKWLLPISLISLIAMDSCRCSERAERKAGSTTEATESKDKGSKDKDAHYQNRPEPIEAPKPGNPGGVEKPKGKD